ncbi:MAG: glycosyltransferase family 2 protein, partial [Acidobacteriota bacterium]
TCAAAGKTAIDMPDAKMARIKSPRLAMSLLVRDEASLIAHNIHFHSRLGVDCFVVTDNGSADGTREILAGLQRQYPIVVIDEPERTMKQDDWVNRMARIAAEEFGAKWIINGDADEFWLPASGTLKSVIPLHDAVLHCRRVNMLATREQVEAPDYAFYRNALRVSKPYGNAPFHQPPWELSEIPIVMAAVANKVMCRLNGLRGVGYGNHHAAHEGSSAECQDILIYHYPVRTFPEFLSKVINHGTSLENNPGIPAHIGWHVRRWFALYKQGLIEEEYRRLFVAREQVDGYLAEGILTVDHTIASIMAQSEPNRPNVE